MAETAKSGELKACPFCGGTDVLVMPPTCKRSDAYDAADRAMPVARCLGCSAETLGENWDATCDSAIAAWNTRTTCDIAEHTEGPWKFQYTDESGECFIIAANLGGMVGAALPWPTEIEARDFRRVIANARLMSASPDLLTALKKIVLDWDGEPEDMAEAREAIAKAEGRS